MKKEYDVFLSHNYRNKPWVSKFFEFLNSQGLSVFFDEESINYGENIVTAIEDGIEKSNRIVLILSPYSLASNWVSLESSIAIYSDPDSRSRKIIPVVLESVKESDIKPSIRLLNRADLSMEFNREKTLRKLFSQLGIKDSQSVEIPSSLLNSTEMKVTLTKNTFSIDDHLQAVRKSQEKGAGYNVALIGKTGVGKSALLNYIFNQAVRKVGVGTPVTERGFHRESFKVHDIPVTFFDSWGLEVGASDEWIKLLKEELQTRSTEKPVQEWFHTVFYCIAASSARIEDFEIEILRNLIQERYQVIVIFTKSDLVANDDLDSLSSRLDRAFPSNEKIRCIPVCSEEKQLRTGKTEKFGIEVVYTSIFEGFWCSISARLPSRCVSILIGIIDEWNIAQQRYIDEKYKFLARKEVCTALAQNSEILVHELKSEKVATVLSAEIENIVSAYGKFARLIRDDIAPDLTDFAPENMDVNLPNLWVEFAKRNASELKTIGLAFALNPSVIVKFLSIVGFSAIGSAVAGPLTILQFGYAAKVILKEYSNIQKEKEEVKEKIEQFSSLLRDEVRQLEPKIRESIEMMEIAN